MGSVLIRHQPWHDRGSLNIASLAKVPTQRNNFWGQKKTRLYEDNLSCIICHCWEYHPHLSCFKASLRTSPPCGENMCSIFLIKVLFVKCGLVEHACFYSSSPVSGNNENERGTILRKACTTNSPVEFPVNWLFRTLTWVQCVITHTRTTVWMCTCVITSLSAVQWLCSILRFGCHR